MKWLSLAIVLFSLNAFADEMKFQIFANKTAPYGLKFAELGKSEGLVIEIMEGALIHAGLEVSKPAPDVPWTESQNQGKETPNSLIIPFARTPAREANFRWISIVTDEKLFAYGRSDKAPPGSFDELFKEKLIGVAAGGAPESRAKDLKLKYESAANEEENFKKLAAGKIDVVLSQGYIGSAEIKKLGAQGAKITRGKALLDLPLWAATSLKTSDKALLKARSAIDAFKRSPEYQKILSRY